MDLAPKTIKWGGMDGMEISIRQGYAQSTFGANNTIYKIHKVIFLIFFFYKILYCRTSIPAKTKETRSFMEKDMGNTKKLFSFTTLSNIRCSSIFVGFCFAILVCVFQSKSLKIKIGEPCETNPFQMTPRISSTHKEKILYNFNWSTDIFHQK